MSYVPLDWPDLVLAALLLLVNGLLSVAFRLGLERTLASQRCAWSLQLGLIGFVLKLLFVQTSVFWVMLAALVMAGVAGHEVWARQSSRVGAVVDARARHRHAAVRERRHQRLCSGAGHGAGALVDAALLHSDPRHDPRQRADRRSARIGDADGGRASWNARASRRGSPKVRAVMRRSSARCAGRCGRP